MLSVAATKPLKAARRSSVRRRAAGGIATVTVVAGLLGGCGGGGGSSKGDGETSEQSHASNSPPCERSFSGLGIASQVEEYFDSFKACADAASWFAAATAEKSVNPGGTIPTVCGAPVAGTDVPEAIRQSTICHQWLGCVGPEGELTGAGLLNTLDRCDGDYFRNEQVALSGEKGYLVAGNSICRERNPEIEAGLKGLAEALNRGEKTQEDLTTFYRERTLPGDRAKYERLGTVKVPPGVQADWNAMIDAARKALSLVEQNLGLDTSPEEQAAWFEDFARRAQALGLTDCAGNPEGGD